MGYWFNSEFYFINIILIIKFQSQLIMQIKDNDATRYGQISFTLTKEMIDKIDNLGVTTDTNDHT